MLDYTRGGVRGRPDAAHLATGLQPMAASPAIGGVEAGDHWHRPRQQTGSMWSYMQIGAVRGVDRLLSQPPVPSWGMWVLSRGAALPADAPSQLLELLAWWEAKAAGDLPDRSALDPVEIGHHLHYVALLDVEEGDFRFRLGGEEMRSRYGPLRGRKVSELLSGEARTEALAEHRACAVSRRPTLAHRSEPAADGTEKRRYWRLLLPFGCECSAVILAAMHFNVRRSVTAQAKPLL